MLRQDQAQQQLQRIDPKVIMANALLQLSGVEFQQAIEAEIVENPALELEDEQPCTSCEMSPFNCGDCQYNAEQQRVDYPNSDELTLQDLENIFESTGDSDEQLDTIGRMQSEITLHEYLRTQLRSLVSGTLYEIGDYLINYINEHGYLECDLLEITLEVEGTDEEIAETVSIIQTFDPPGVGARDLRECLMIQLAYLAEEGNDHPIAYHMVEDFWDEMRSHKLNRIARRLKVKSELVRDEMRFISTKLNPYPASGFRAPWESKASENKSAIRPDVIIRRTPTGYEVEVVGNEHISLVVNPYYRKIYSEISNNGSSAKHSEDEKKHISEYVDRAELFIKNLNQRRKTLRTITRCIAEVQHGFLDTGMKLYLRSFTRVKLAEMLKMHESTVSRATSGKFVQLPNQEVVSFDFFFQSSPLIADMIVDLVNHEDSSHPLSDQDLAGLITERGYPIARRTVVKYREASKILSSRQRRL